MNGRNHKKSGWGRSLLAMLAVLLFAFTNIDALGAELTPGMSGVSGDGDFVIWYRSPEAESLIDLYADGQSDILDRITLVSFYDYSTYLSDLEAILTDPENPLYPDLIFLEPDYAGVFLEGETLLSAEDLEVTATDMIHMFPFTIDNGKDSQGEIRTFYATAAPGAYQVRADLAQKYLGTSDPTELHERYFSDWKKMMAAARTVYIKSEGMVALFPGYWELYGGLAMPEQDFSWTDQNNAPADAAQIARMMRISFGFERYTLGTQQWSMEWMDAMSGDGVRTPAAIAYAGSPWFTAYCLMDNWKTNTVIVEGPADFQWGGLGMAATAGCSDVDFATDIIRTLCCNTDVMTEMASGGNFVNNQEALYGARELGYGDCDYLRGQDLFEAYLPVAEDTAGNTLTPYDLEIRDMYLYSLKEYIEWGGGMQGSIERGEQIRDALKEMIASH